MQKILAGVVVSLGLIAAGCSQEGNQADAAKDAAAVPQAAAAPAQPAANPHAGTAAQPIVGAANEGRVLKVVDAPGYTYLEVEFGGQPVWLASNPVAVKVGDDVRWGQYVAMRDFHSKALNQIFPVLLMTSSVVSADAPLPAAPQGKVVTLLSGGGYNYLEVDAAAGKLWLAAPMSPVKVGDTVRWSAGAPMRNFSSSSLGRTFELVYFIGGVQVVN